MCCVKEIKRFQTDRLLDKQPYNHKTEVLHILEELVEMLGFESLYARDRAETIYQHFIYYEPVEDDKLVDAYADIIVFAIGSIMKLGYEPECVLNEVAKEINSRVGSIIDGKFIKDKSPEARAKWYKADYEKCKKDKDV
jgi:predicted HAD superfamily Cof-like phosphohydrolase